MRRRPCAADSTTGCSCESPGVRSRVSDEPRVQTDSGIEVKALYDAVGPRRLGPRGAARCARAGRRTRAASTRRCTAASCGRCGSTPASARRRRPTSASSSCSHAGQTGLSCAFDLPTQMGYDSDHPRAEGEVGKVGVAIDSLDDMRMLLADLPLDKVTTSMTINSTGGDPAAAVRARRRGAGRAVDRDQRHDPERPAQGVHRPRHLHLPAAAEHADHHRHLRVLREARAAVEHDLDQRLPHPRGRLDGGAGDRVHARQRHRLRARRRSTPGSTSTTSRRGCRFFWNAHNNFFEEVAKFRAARRIWYRLMTERFGAQKEPSRSCCASTPRPAARRSPRSSRRTTSSASPCSRWPR